MKALLVEDSDLGGNRLEAYYCELSSFRAMAVDTDDPARRAMWELVACGLGRVPSDTRKLLGRSYPTGGFYFFGPYGPAIQPGAPGEGSAALADALAVKALSEVLEEMKPEWAAAVEDARRLADSAEVMAAWSEVPIEAVLAVLGDWRA